MNCRLESGARKDDKMFTSCGTLRYSPTLLGGKSEKWWIILDCDPELGRYYRHLFNLNCYRTQTLTKPSWAEHITVVRNEEPPDKKSWEKYAGERVEFNYLPIFEDNESYYWFEVQCVRLDEIRVELGLPKEPEYPYHITIGNDITKMGK